MGIKIRRATLSDLGTLKKFQSHLVEFERPLDPTIKKGSVEYYNLENKLKSTRTLFLIAEANGKPVGCGLGEVMKSAKWSKHKYKGYIGLMFVEKEFRGKGIGSMIMGKLLEWLKEKRISDVRLQAYAKNTGAINAYKKHGFSEHILEMRKSLSK